MNPLLEDFNTAPFSKILSTDYKPAIKEAIEICKQEIETIISNPETPSFQNTTEALEFTGQKLGRITSIFFNLNSAETSEAIQKIAQEISPWLSEFKNDMILNSALFTKVKSVYDTRGVLNLDSEQTMLLEKQYKGFSRNGANLNNEDKEKLRKIDTELSKLSLQFGENVLADSNAFKLHITDEKDLKGLPDGAKEAANLLAKNQNKEGWLITLDYPSYIPFVTYAENRTLRKKLAIAFGKKGFQNNENNNEEIVLNIVKLRHQRANLLGYKTHAHFVLEERMAETPEKVLSFSEDLLRKAKPAAL
ncbi:M3 family metallopeptidase, partial [Flavobacteriaceae bacterium]|nr:M3 family metallopeptidase [Flavobacteriaceae bacterium]